MSNDSMIFGRYQLLEPIAKGGMAEVFKAKLVVAAGTEKVLCIKRILPTHSSNQAFISLFVKEAKITLNLSHGNITQVFDFGEVDGVYFLAMEYISGQDLNATLARVRDVNSGLDLPASLYIAAEVCKGLQYAHAFSEGSGKPQPVVHRDVTPHNILISYTGQVKLTDFGIALAATKVDAKEEVVRGKACYLSPEQAEGQAGSPSSDIFSMGTVIYEMLTGVRPFEGESDEETLERVRTLEVEPPSAHNEDVDPTLDQIVLKAIAKAPEERYSRAGDLQVALTQVLHQKWPDYTAENLSDSIKELFAWEIAKAEGEISSDQQRDRLLFQLSRAGVKVDDQKATTAELLELGTVALPGAVIEEQPKLSKNKYLLMGGGGLALIAILIALVLIPDTTPRMTGIDRENPHPAPQVIRPTEHLSPHSIQTPTYPTPKKQIPTTKRKKTNHRKVVQRVAYLNCNSWPWSVVYINGRRIQGNTPLFRVRVHAGKHKIRFVNPELGLSKEVVVSINAGDTRTVTVSLQQ